MIRLKEDRKSPALTGLFLICNFTVRIFYKVHTYP